VDVPIDLTNCVSIPKQRRPKLIASFYIRRSYHRNTNDSCSSRIIG